MRICRTKAVSDISLGRGESAAIALALEYGAERILLDDKAARRLAFKLNTRVLGTLGILLRAKEQNLISEIQSQIDALDEFEFHISPALRRLALSEAGELL